MLHIQNMFVDNIRIFARAGKGGNGLVSFRRAKFVPKGGPDGGDGGDGGSVILEVDPHTNDLRSFFYDPKLIATDGVGGQSAKKHGKNGKSVIGKVPPGTIIYRSNASSMAEATWLEREGEGIELEKIADLTEIGTRFTLCQGGIGGKGNWHFRSATNQAPTEAEMGTEGEEGVFFMELRRIADAGLVGYPNAGKSTLLGDISEAKPKVANYPFTTLQPIIGVVEFDSFRRCVVADIPGILKARTTTAAWGMNSCATSRAARCSSSFWTWPAAKAATPLKTFKTSARKSSCTVKTWPNSPGSSSPTKWTWKGRKKTWPTSACVFLRWTSSPFPRSTEKAFPGSRASLTNL